MTWTLLRVGAVLLPTIVLGWQVFALERDLANHTIWRLPIAGFDPRDPVRGHYVLFRYDWPLTESERATCEASGRDCRLCLQAEASAVSVSAFTGGEPTGQCDAILLADPSPGQEGASLLGGQRFYLDEGLARDADAALLNPDRGLAEMEVAVTQSGRLRALRLYVEGELIAGTAR